MDKAIEFSGVPFAFVRTQVHMQLLADMADIKTRAAFGLPLRPDVPLAWYARKHALLAFIMRTRADRCGAVRVCVCV